MNHGNRALNLAYYEMLGDVSLTNKQVDLYRAVTAEDIQKTAAGIFTESNSNVLFYRSKK
jgi:zinc protease